ncbi:unnamed protein product [Allacma fusca]|uniref:Uncharacterized protein n=1 Tax=Allacma fusca TaxID=39272 RepID=A0A8J2NR65_9HEXA|nr:unnamed protein product [Allacma fusca]
MRRLTKTSLGDDPKNNIKLEQKPVPYYRLFRFLSVKDRLWLTLAVFSALIASACVPVLNVLFGEMAELMVNAQEDPLYCNGSGSGGHGSSTPAPKNNQKLLDGMAKFSAYMLAAGVIEFIAGYFFVTTFCRLAEIQMYRLRIEYLRALLRQDIGWYDTVEDRDFVSKISENVTKVRQAVGETASMCTFFLLSSIICLAFALWYGWFLTLVVLLSSSPVIAVSSAIVGCLQAKLASKQEKSYSDAGMVAQEALSNIKTVMAFSGQQKEAARYEKKLAKSLRAGRIRGVVTAFGNGFLWFLNYATYSLVLWYGSKLIFEGRKEACTKTPEYNTASLTVIFFNVLIASFNFGQALSYLEIFSVGRVAAASIYNIIDRIPEIDIYVNSGISRKERLKGLIEFKHVHFCYPSRKDVVKYIQLLHGSVIIDGTNIRELNINWLPKKYKTIVGERVRKADMIIAIKNGQVVEIGSHDSLMSQQGFYYNLVVARADEIDEQENLESKLMESATSMEPPEDQDILESVIFPPLEKELKQLAKHTSLFSLLRLNSKEWPWITLGFFIALLQGGMLPLDAYFYGQFMGVLSKKDTEKAQNEVNLYACYYLGVGVYAILTVGIGLSCFSISGEALTNRLRKLSFETMLKQDLTWYDNPRNNVGGLCMRLSGDAASVQGATGTRLGLVAQAFTTIGISASLGLYLLPKLGLVACAFVPFILIANFYNGKLLENQQTEEKLAIESASSCAFRAVSCIRTVASLGKEKAFVQVYTESLLPPHKKAVAHSHLLGLVFGFSQGMLFFAYAAVFYYGAYLISHENVDYTNVFIIGEALVWSMLELGQTLAFAPSYNNAKVAGGRILTLLESKRSLQDDPGSGLPIGMYAGGVAFDQVKFSYPERKSTTVLKGLSFGIEPNKNVGICGPSGSGKSTCIQLILRYYVPTMGKVLLDDTCIQDINLDSLRSHMAIVAQEPALFDRTFAENISYGDNSRDVSMDEIMEAAKSANIHSFISSLPLGYSTRLDAPGIAMDYKIHVDAGKEDCYYQYVHPGATLYVGFQVLRGGDGQAGFAVRHPNGQIVHPYAWKAQSDYQETSAVGGYYAVCVDNQFSRFAAKLINLYITTFRYDEWEKYTKELESLDISVTNFTGILSGVDQKIGQVLHYLHQTRARESRDYALLEDNQSYVSFWSILQCLIIAATSSVQVYFVRKLFDSPSHGGGKVRA